MFGWLSFASARASRVKRATKSGESASTRRQDFQRHERGRAEAAAPCKPRPCRRGRAFRGSRIAAASSPTSAGSPMSMMSSASPTPAALGGGPEAAFIRHCGQRPSGASAASGCWHWGQVRVVSMECGFTRYRSAPRNLLPAFLQNHAASAAKSAAPPRRPHPRSPPSRRSPRGPDRGNATASDAPPRAPRLRSDSAARRSPRTAIFSPVSAAFEFSKSFALPAAANSRRKRASTCSSNVSAQRRSKIRSAVA